MNQDQQEERQNLKKDVNTYAKYSGMGIQMVVIVALVVFAAGLKQMPGCGLRNFRFLPFV